MIASMALETTSHDAPQTAGATAASAPSPEGFDRIFETHHDAVFRYAAARLGPQEAEDLVGEVFAAAFAKRRTFDPARADTALPWLLGIATRLISRRRNDQRRWIRNLAATLDSRLGEDGNIDDALGRLDAARVGEQLATAVIALPRRQRDVLLLHVLGDLSYEETADALDLPVGTVRSRINRARTKLATCLEQERP